jgi:HlyD family secretion protein
MRNALIISLFVALFAQGCGNGEVHFDAAGVFEADEVIISAEAAGRLVQFDVREGQTLKAGWQVGAVDCAAVDWQRRQAQASLQALSLKTNSAAPQILIYQQQIEAQRAQIAVLEQQLAVQQREQARLQKLVDADAAPRKQLDDLEGVAAVLDRQITAAARQITVLEKQIIAQKEAVAIQNRGILSEQDPMSARLAQFDEQLARCAVVNPIDGTVLSKYAEAHEVVAPGKALYKIAALDTLTLRAYVGGDQLPKLRLGQSARVMVDDGEGAYRELSGHIVWIADKAEFTPKTIQTKKERQNLVYAIKISVKNDGYLKIGMYGETRFE